MVVEMVFRILLSIVTVVGLLCWLVLMDCHFGWLSLPVDVCYHWQWNSPARAGMPELREYIEQLKEGQ